MYRKYGDLSRLPILDHKTGPFLVSCVLFFLIKEASREGLAFTMESTFGFKDQRGKPYFMLNSQYFGIFRSLFSEQASPEFLGKCL